MRTCFASARAPSSPLSVVVAFLLFGLLQSINSIFSAGANFVGATRLMTQARVSSPSPCR
jgi:putative ABC transport system permease protein